MTLTILIISETLLILQTSCNMAFEHENNQNAWTWVLTMLLAVLDCFNLQLIRLLLYPIWSNLIKLRITLETTIHGQQAHAIKLANS